MKHLENAFGGDNRKFWYYILVLLGTFFAASILAPVLLGIYALRISVKTDDPFIDIFNAIADGDASQYGVSQNATLALMLGSFVLFFIVFKYMVGAVHEKKLSEIINGRKKIRINRVLWGAAIWALIIIVSTLIGLYFTNPEDFQFQFDISKFIPLVIISLLLIPFQSAFEEIIFRGYIPQLIALKGGSRLLVLIIPSILFALMHAGNPEVAQFGFWPSMVNYLVMGLMFGIVSVLDDGIETAIGAHIANNICCSLLLTHNSSALRTDALFVLDVNSININHDTLLGIVSAIIFISILYRKFDWNFRVFKRKVERPVELVAQDGESPT